MTVNLAFIGAGGIADRHANVLKRVDEARISVVCDIDQDPPRTLSGTGPN